MFLTGFVIIIGGLLIVDICCATEQYSDPISLVNRLKETYLHFCPEALSDSLSTEFKLRTRFSQPVSVATAVYLYRFIEIDDHRHSLSVWADITFSWSYPCSIPECRDIFDNNDEICHSPEATDLYFHQSTDNIWLPRLTHYNAMEHARSIEVYWGGYMWVYPFYRYQAYSEAVGRFDTSCNFLSLQAFPFDKVKCSLIFDADEPIDSVQFSVDAFKISSEFIEEDVDDWSVDGPLEFSVQNISIANDESSHFVRIVFTISFRRKAGYFLSNLIGALITLFTVQLATLTMAPDERDRPALNMIVLLSSSILIGVLHNSVPSTTWQTVYIVGIAFAHFFGGIIIAAYTLLMYVVSDRLHFRSRPLQSLTWPRFIDIIFGVMLTLSTLFVDCYYCHLLMSA